ncbi:MAG TPA: hypothetical protein VFC51_14990 [Chloroflexota bacterium]|nr:hypothetical protein [Chloroflexota bacterium]
MKSARISLSLPADLLGLLEGSRAPGQSRSELIVQALDAELPVTG